MTQEYMGECDLLWKKDKHIVFNGKGVKAWNRRDI